jgi:uncharacterized membrane-anchored protein YhcB (DUF1043 family)
MTLAPELVAAIALALGGIAFFIGRATSVGTARIRDLEARLEAAHKEVERALAEIAASRATAQKVRDELDGYRRHVVEHFVGASDLMRDLTVQYRAVYDHLTEGASQLCPEGFVLDRGAEAGLLPLEATPASSKPTS